MHWNTHGGVGANSRLFCSAINSIYDKKTNSYNKPVDCYRVHEESYSSPRVDFYSENYKSIVYFLFLHFQSCIHSVCWRHCEKSVIKHLILHLRLFPSSHLFWNFIYQLFLNIHTVINQASKLQPQKTTLVGLNRKGIYLKGQLAQSCWKNWTPGPENKQEQKKPVE